MRPLRARALIPALAALIGAVDCSSRSPAAASPEAGNVPEGPSCRGGGAGLSACGSTGEDSCCSSLPVPSGDFFRSYDGISTNGASDAYSAKVSELAVDKYEVTVARFRVFVAADIAGFRPASGSGKHSHLQGGNGLNGGTEPGWNAAWDASLAATFEAWSTNLSCDPDYGTWTDVAGANEDHPVNCVSWYEAYAFCIWDGGFLPSESEWNYVGSGGQDQRVYPWSAAFPPGGTTLDCAHATYASDWPGQACVPSGTTKVGAESPLGDGKWGHADLAGNVFEWTLDFYATLYTVPCDDCADLEAAAYRVIRGGSFDASPACLLNALRETSAPADRSSGIGLRCARPPN